MKIEKAKRDFDKKIIEALKKQYHIVTWSSLDGVISKCQLSLKAFRRDYNEIEFKLEEQNLEAFKKVITGDKTLKIYIPETSISFSCQLKSFEEDSRIKVTIPNDYTFFERRKHERVAPEKRCYAHIDFNGLRPKLDVHDISMGGFSVIFPKSNKMSIAIKQQFQNVCLDLIGHRIETNVECTGSVVIDPFRVESLPYGGFKISFKFLALSKADSDFLADFISYYVLKKREMKEAN